MTLLAITLLALGQVAIEHQPDLDAMKAAVHEARAKRPLDAAKLLAIKQGPIEPTLAADLEKFDWYLPGTWSYPEKCFSVDWFDDGEVYQYHLNRYLPGGGELAFSFGINRLDPAKAEVTHVNFTLPPNTSMGVKKLGKDTWVEVIAFGEKELHRVVSYERGVLILDISYDGKRNSKTVKFRDVRIALPRLFESAGK